MPVPTGYTEDTLKTYMHTEADTGSPSMATVLGWTVADLSYDEILNDVLLDLDVSNVTTITGASNIRKLRLLSKVHVWRAIVAGLATKHTFSADGASYKRSDLQSMALATLALAEDAASAYLDLHDDDNQGVVCITPIVHRHNLYAHTVDEEDRTL